MFMSNDYVCTKKLGKRLKPSCYMPKLTLGDGEEWLLPILRHRLGVSSQPNAPTALYPQDMTAVPVGHEVG